MPSYKFSKNSKSLKKNIKRNKSSTSQSKQLLRTNQRIDALALKVADQKAVYGLKAEFYPDSLVPLTDYASVPITPALVAYGNTFPVWSNCFSDDTNALESQRARLGRMYTKLGFYANSENGPVSFSVFHVKLREDTAENVVSECGHDLASLTVDRDFIRAHGTGIDSGQATHVMLNPTKFRTIKKWSFTLMNRYANTSNEAPVGSPSQLMKVIEYSFPLGYKLGDSQADWKDQDVLDSTPLTMRNYILIFCDNSSLDAANPSYRFLCQCNATA